MSQPEKFEPKNTAEVIESLEGLLQGCERTIAARKAGGIQGKELDSFKDAVAQDMKELDEIKRKHEELEAQQATLDNQSKKLYEKWHDLRKVKARLDG